MNRYFFATLTLVITINSSICSNSTQPSAEFIQQTLDDCIRSSPRVVDNTDIVTRALYEFRICEQRGRNVETTNGHQQYARQLCVRSFVGEICYLKKTLRVTRDEYDGTMVKVIHTPDSVRDMINNVLNSTDKYLSDQIANFELNVATANVQAAQEQLKKVEAAIAEKQAAQQLRVREADKTSANPQN